MVVSNVLVFFCLSLYSVSIYIRFYDDWHPFAEKKLSAMAAERIRTKKLLAEVTKDLTPEQINGKSVLVFKKNCWRQICYVFKMIAYKKRSALLFSWLCTDYTRKQFFFLFLNKRATMLNITKVLEMLFICMNEFFVNIQVYVAIPLSRSDIKA